MKNNEIGTRGVKGRVDLIYACGHNMYTTEKEYIYKE